MKTVGVQKGLALDQDVYKTNGDTFLEQPEASALIKQMILFSLGSLFTMFPVTVSKAAYHVISSEE